MNNLLIAARHALIAIETQQAWGEVDPTFFAETITALRQAIEQAERPTTHSDECWRWHHACAIARIKRAEQQEPVAWIEHIAGGVEYNPYHKAALKLPEGMRFDLYTYPPQRKPLVDEAIRDLWSWSMTAEAERTANTQQHAFARAIERAHGITGDNT